MSAPPETSACPGCGLVLPVRHGPSHAYIGASPACWALYGELLAREYGELRYPPSHRLTVDVYAVQHPGSPERRSIQSVAGPPDRTVTVRDVLGSRDLAEHAANVERWAHDVWDAWTPYHERVRGWIEAAL